MTRRILAIPLSALVLLSSAYAQPSTPTAMVTPPKAIYTPAPVYRPEWAKQKLAGKGAVLITIDKASGNVIGAKMLESTGNSLLDGAALEAYSKWRFQPGGTVSQLKMPIEFRSGPPSTPQRTGRPPSSSAGSPSMLWLIVVFVLGAAAMAFVRRSKTS